MFDLRMLLCDILYLEISICWNIVQYMLQVDIIPCFDPVISLISQLICTLDAASSFCRYTGCILVLRCADNRLLHVIVNL